jgi:hypothetical protein
MAEGAWIFLSHSHQDFEKIRSLRDQLEKRQHHPLVFFLKCLDDDSEIDDLIRREIAARSWFILCDSANSRTSKWVKREREIIQSLPDHSFVTVDLDAEIETQLESLAALLKRASVFPSYVRSDQARVAPILEALRSADFGVFSDLDIPGGSDFVREIEAALRHAANNGAILVFLSRSSLSSQWQRHEIALALRLADTATQPANVVPVFLDPPASLIDLLPDFGQRLLEQQGFDFSNDQIPRNIERLIGWLRGFPWPS